ncbi:hypothetical protein RT97_17165 [Variovorax paradoxus]|uniref:Alpha/beta hydrolase n=1 Tax=Variovorax paradoxus TaxID=34073 RepID=A0A0D0KXJ3_VARPD|nr:hypothetical protein [Variovorax paradoxus]KIQ30917.1 hypothetical protein RT97_17165 [Variovorax paradoxus]
MPVPAFGAEQTFDDNMAIVMRKAATNVRVEVVPGAGHWLMKESPAATAGPADRFLAAPQ